MRIVTLVFFVLLVSAGAGAQPARPGTVTRSDSLRILRTAKSAQMQFEARRRFLAPRTNDGARGPCQTIGRFCRHPSGVQFAEIPDEPPGTAIARRKLLLALASASARLPGDGWIVGQLVRYLIEAGDDSSARETAEGCRADRWWCLALAGLAAHTSAHFAAAERAFVRSLQEMPTSRRCEWTDLSILLEGDALGAYRKVACEARETVNRRIWWLADPLFSTPGNERRTGHFARHVWAEIDRGGTNGFGMSWAGDMKELIIRFGWPEKWTQQARTGLGYTSVSYVAHEREPDFHFLPAVSYDAPLSALDESAWKLSEERPREGYSPPYATTFTSIKPQLARFRRGDSTLVVAAFDVTDDTAWRHPAVRPALVIAPSDTARFLLALFDSTARKSALWVTTPSAEMLAGVELISLDGKAAGRWRGVVQPIPNDSGKPAISDLLLFDATDSLASTLDGAIASAYGNNSIAQDRKVGVYWESYGDTAADSARAVSLTLTPIAPSLVTRVIRALGVGKKLAPVDVRWRDASAGATMQPRSVLLDLSQVAPGRYELRLAIGEGQAARSAARDVVIGRGSRLAVTR